jgi:predicted metalloprotease with PDZ domain
MTDFFADYVYGTENYEPLLSELLQEVGCVLERTPASVANENRFGFRVVSSVGTTRVTAVLPGSVADRNGIGKDDELVAVGGHKVEGNLDELLRASEGQEVVLTLLTPMKRVKDVVLPMEPVSYYHRYRIRSVENPTINQQTALQQWLHS